MRAGTNHGRGLATGGSWCSLARESELTADARVLFPLVSPARNTLIIVLALTAIGTGVLAWRQYEELVGLRAAALDPSERADLQKRIADLTKENRDLQDQLMAAHGVAADESDGAEAPADRPAETAKEPDNRRGSRGRGNFGQQFAAYRELMAKPEVQALLTNEQKGMLDARYAALFKNLNLPPEQLDKLKTLLLDRQNVFQDVLSAARDQGIDPREDRDAFRKLVTDAQNSINDNIKSLLGDSGYSQFTNYEQTMPQRNIVNALQQRLTYTDSPLTSSQADQLVQILASNAPAVANETGGGRRGGEFMGRGVAMLAGGDGGGVAIVGPGAAPITASAVNQAQSVLTQTQVSALQQLQQQQQNAQQLQQLYRNAIRQGNGGNATRKGGD